MNCSKWFRHVFAQRQTVGDFWKFQYYVKNINQTTKETFSYCRKFYKNFYTTLRNQNGHIITEKRKHLQ